MSQKCLHGEVLVLISQQGPEILSSLHFVPYWGLASIKALVPKSLKTSEVCLKSAQLAKHWCQYVNRVLSNWAASVLTLFCPYLRGQSTFWGYFFTGGALSYRPFGFWCHFDPKWPFWGLASMEVGWPQKSWDLIKWYKSALHAKFDHYTTSGSWVMCNSVQKTPNAHPPLLCHQAKYWLFSNPPHPNVNFFHIWNFNLLKMSRNISSLAEHSATMCLYLCLYQTSRVLVCGRGVAVVDSIPH